MANTHLITVGKLKEKHYQSLEQDYLVRIKNPSLIIHEVKSCKENLDKEAQEVLKKINEISKGGPSQVILLTENGKNFDSLGFSKWLYTLHSRQDSKIIFVIGGASGHGNNVIKKSSEKISLSKMTFPHKMARLVLIEQLYRAQTLFEGHPYHK
jgi:23S rRNA (pseudouridine1915-N3)-methyltransferase